MRRGGGWVVGMLLAVGCGGGYGGGGGSTASPPAAVITITGFTFSPESLTVAPGATVTVVNKDSTGHSVTSETAPGVFSPGAVSGVQFDTGVFTGTTTFTIPASAPEGTVVPYYCRVHKGMMVNKGQVVISKSGTGGGGGGTHY